MVELTRRGFLAGLFATAVIVANVPKASLLADVIEPIDPWGIKAPPGWTYQWVRSALLGEPDPENVQKRLDNGWTFVLPAAHPGAPVSTVQKAIETSGLILMQKTTAAVDAYAAQFKCQDCKGVGKVEQKIDFEESEGAIVWRQCQTCRGSGRKPAAQA
jgi:hypothetical protein